MGIEQIITTHSFIIHDSLSFSLNYTQIDYTSIGIGFDLGPSVSRFRLIVIRFLLFRPPRHVHCAMSFDHHALNTQILLILHF